MFKRLACLTLTLGSFASPVFAQQCLHGNAETTEQAARRKEALQVTRTVNNLQANQPGARSDKYFIQQELMTSPFAATSQTAKRLNFALDADVIPGWQLTLNLTTNGYWFMVKDKTDPCGFAYISNQAGLIFSAEPIR
jgi:hypothetical protein